VASSSFELFSVFSLDAVDVAFSGFEAKLSVLGGSRVSSLPICRRSRSPLATRAGNAENGGRNQWEKGKKRTITSRILRL
jgi:hypothetical protein